MPASYRLAEGIENLAARDQRFAGGAIRRSSSKKF